jgi:hypothetical protein
MMSIPPRDRDQFLRDVTAELSKHEVIDPGVIGRVCSKLQRQHLNGPRDLRGVGGWWQ